MRPGERQPVPDPRLFLKNFGMPMNTALTGEMLVGGIRRKEAEAIKPRAPSVIAGMGGDGAVERKFREFNSVPPLFCTLIRKANGDRFVTVSEGCAAEVIPQSSGDDEDEIENRDGVQEHPIGDPDNPGSGIWQQEFPNLLQEHGPITEGQVVGIAFTTTKEGYIDSPLTIEVRDYENRVSTHYQPPVGPDDGTAGTCFYVLARLTGTGGTEKLEIWHAGSNIDYVHDTPPFKMLAGGVHDIFQWYNLEAGQYEYLGLKGIAPIVLTRPEGGPNIEVSLLGVTGADLDLTIKYWSFETEADTTVDVEIPSEVVTIESGGEHFHTLAAHTHFANLDPSVVATNTGISWEDFTRTGQSYSGVPTTDDGAHPHAFTIPARTIQIPVRGRHFIQIGTTYDVLCWRAGIFVGNYHDGAALPDLTGGGVEHIEKTIYSYDGPPAPPLAPVP